MMTNLLRRISVFWRIVLLAGLGLVAVVLVSAFGLNARNVLMDANTRILKLEELQRAVTDLRLNSEKVRGHLSAFMHAPIEHVGEKLKAGMTDVVGQVGDLAPLAVDASMAGRFADLQTITSRALSQIEAARKGQVALGATRNTGTRGDVHVAGRDLEAAVRSELGNTTSILLYRLHASVQAMIRHTERLMTERNPAVEAELEIETARIERILQLQQLPPAFSAELSEKLGAHVRFVARWMEGAAGFDAEIVGIENSLTLMVEPLGLVADQINALVASTRANASAQQNTDELIALTGALIVLLCCGLMAILIARSITRPLHEISAGMEKIARGDTETVLNGQDAADEIGTLTRAAAVFRNEMLVRQQHSERTAEHAAERSQRAEQVSVSVRQFDHSIGQVLTALEATGTRLTASSQDLDVASRTVAERTRVAQEATETMNGRINMVAAATDELSSSIAAIAGDTGRAATAAEGAISQVDETQKRMQELLVISGQIGDVVALIRQIASQTNLLALNATIEAARAGESGRGFAVVASEVKTLASHTQAATEEIGRKIEAIQGGARNMSESIEDMSRVVLEMRDIAVDMAASIRQQDATVVEIASTMAMLAGDASVNSSSVRETNQAAVAADEVAREVRDAARSMQSVSARLSGDVGNFISSVRAA